MWLLRLYPLAWRQRYGDEMAALVRNHRWTPSLVVDLIAGAIDAWLNPELIASVADGETLESKEHKTMVAKVLGLRCAGYGPKLQPHEQWLSIAIMLGATLLLTAVWLWVAATYRDPQVRQYVLAFVQVPLLGGLILGMPFSALKGRPRSTQAIVIGVSFLLLIVWCAVVGLVASVT